MVRGWWRRVGAGALVLGLMAAGAPGRAAATYPTSDACWNAEHRSCYRLADGTWAPIENTGGPGEASPVPPPDPEFKKHQDESMFIQTSGTADQPVVAVDMNQVIFPDVQPYLDNEIGRVRVPVRFVSEQMGAQVAWDESAQAVTITREGLQITLQVDNPAVTVNDRTITIDAPPKLLPPGRVMVPLRFVSEAFGAAVDWVGTETPTPISPDWGKYQVWIWVPWGYWGKHNIHERLYDYKWWWTR
jgi:hypothetical protein